MKNVFFTLIALFAITILSANEGTKSDNAINQLEMTSQVANAMIQADANAYLYAESGFCQQTDAYATTTYMYQSDGTATKTVVRNSDGGVISHTRISHSMATAICAYLAPAG